MSFWRNVQRLLGGMDLLKDVFSSVVASTISKFKDLPDLCVGIPRNIQNKCSSVVESHIRTIWGLC